MGARNGGQNRQQSLGFRSTVSTGIDRQTSLSNKSCFICSSTMHLRKDCRHRDKSYNTRTALEGNRPVNKPTGARVFTCSAYNRSNDVTLSSLRPVDNVGHGLSNCPSEDMCTLASMPNDTVRAHNTPRSLHNYGAAPATADNDVTSQGRPHTHKHL